MARTQGPAADRGEQTERPGGRQLRELLDLARALHTEARTLLTDHAAASATVRTAVAPLRDELVVGELESIPVARLKDVTEGRLRLGAIEAAGLGTVRQVYEASRHELRQIPGVGAHTADQALAAARQIARAVGETVTVRIDVDRPEPRTTALVTALHPLVGAGPELRRALDAARRTDQELSALLPAARPATGRLRMLVAGRRRRVRALAAVDGIRELIAQAAERDLTLLLRQASVDLLRQPASEIESWVDFELRSAEYYSLLAELDEMSATAAGDLTAAEGFLPYEVAERVRAQRLDDTHCRVSLRGYQAFGARFALAQRRVILGDEMGLGKTVQAIAAMAHLAARGETHFLVVCPASVLINWTREIRARSTLKAVPVHGPERADAHAEWQSGGGVAITTFDVLHGLPVPDEFGGRADQARADQARAAVPAMLVVDEAHYVKNPGTRRSRAVAAWTARCARVLFLTGTPMENRVGEFRSLVRYLKPELLPSVHGSDAAAGSQAFRKAVAPAYLRRNQQDVLTELPALLHVDEWEELSAADLQAYREAVADGNFMAMRRAAYARPATSAKLERLCELVDDAAENGLKVVVFSYFRDVLATVGTALRTARPDGPTRDEETGGDDDGGGGSGGGGAGGRSDNGGGGGGRVGAGPRADDTAAAGTGEEPRGHAVFGPISGDVPAARRQGLVDEFGAVSGHAVLLCQIEAGGVGLNLQAASVVILCEPQVKPTLEHQAVARAHRMGQVRTVQVHRLLAERSVDERMLAIVENKSRLFDAYARRSDVADATPDAVDVSDGSLARRIVEEEQRRLAEAGTR